MSTRTLKSNIRRYLFVLLPVLLIAMLRMGASATTTFASPPATPLTGGASQDGAKGAPARVSAPAVTYRSPSPLSSGCSSVNFAPAHNYGTTPDPDSVAIGDFNRDGIQDLAVANATFFVSEVSVLLGDGTGSFGQATNFPVGEIGPFTVAVGDFNGDGKQDLAVENLNSNDVSILLGDGTGSFGQATNFPVDTNPSNAVVGDFNGDGKQDLAVNDQSSSDVSVLLGDGTGSFGQATNFPVGPGPAYMAVGDFNGDGKQDLATADYLSNEVSVLLGDGTGSFGLATNFPVDTNPISVVVGDFNGDGNQDLATTDLGSNDVSVLIGDGKGSFGQATNFPVDTNSSPYSVAVGDFNGDGKQDLAVNDANMIAILLGDGTGFFGQATYFFAGPEVNSVAVGDFNGDSKQDLAVTDQSSNDVTILLNTCLPPTLTPTSIPTSSRTPAPTFTPISSSTLAPTFTPTNVPTNTATRTPAPTFTPPITSTPAPGGQGCGPGFWQGGLGSTLWDRVNDRDWTAHGGVGTNPFTQTILFNSYFTPVSSLNGFSMLKVVGSGGGSNPAQKAARDVVAAYLNTSFGLSFGYTPAQISALWSDAVANNTFDALHNLLAPLNMRSCPIK